MWFEIHSFYTCRYSYSTSILLPVLGKPRNKTKASRDIFSALNNNLLITVFTVRFSTRDRMGGGGGQPETRQTGVLAQH